MKDLTEGQHVWRWNKDKNEEWEIAYIFPAGYQFLIGVACFDLYIIGHLIPGINEFIFDLAGRMELHTIPNCDMRVGFHDCVTDISKQIQEYTDLLDNIKQNIKHSNESIEQDTKFAVCYQNEIAKLRKQQDSVQSKLDKGTKP